MIKALDILNTVSDADIRNLPKADFRQIQALRGFETVFINKLLDVMQQSMQEIAADHDGQFQQISGIFNFYLADMLGKKGGLGLYRQMYENLNQQRFQQTENSLDFIA